LNKERRSYKAVERTAHGVSAAANGRVAFRLMSLTGRRTGKGSAGLSARPLLARFWELAALAIIRTVRSLRTWAAARAQSGRPFRAGSIWPVS